MRTTIDVAGRLVIPKRIRERLGLRGNDQVEITERDGRIEIEPAPTGVELVREGSVLVARPERPLPPLTDEIVRETLDRTGGDRTRHQRAGCRIRDLARRARGRRARAQPWRPSDRARGCGNLFGLDPATTAASYCPCCRPRLLGGHHLQQLPGTGCPLISRLDRPPRRARCHRWRNLRCPGRLHGESCRRKAADSRPRAVETYERLRVEVELVT